MAEGCITSPALDVDQCMGFCVSIGRRGLPSRVIRRTYRTPLFAEGSMVAVDRPLWKRLSLIMAIKPCAEQTRCWSDKVLE